MNSAMGKQPLLARQLYDARDLDMISRQPGMPVTPATAYALLEKQKRTPPPPFPVKKSHGETAQSVTDWFNVLLKMQRWSILW